LGDAGKASLGTGGTDLGFRLTLAADLLRITLPRTPLNKSRGRGTEFEGLSVPSSTLIIDLWLLENHYGPFSAVKQPFPAQPFSACRRETRSDGGVVGL
jgi:hypothetical protein